MSECTEPSVHYDVSIDPDRHEIVVEIRLQGAFARGESMLLETPTWVPGDYTFMQLARDIVSVSAIDETTQQPLEVRREGWQGFRVMAPTGDVRVRYRAYAFEPEFGEPSGILDSDYAVLMGARYLYTKGHLGPCTVTYGVPAKWGDRVHHPSGARHVGGFTWAYPSYEILLDTPVILGSFQVVERTLGDTPFFYVFVDQGLGYAAEVDRFVDDVSATAEFFGRMYGGFPFSDYTFVLSLNPQNDWGLEHLTSTLCGLGPDVFTDPDAFKVGVRVCAHELFHAWNVRRLRPDPLLQLQHQLDCGSFTEGLWVAEGFTRYYEFLSCATTGTYTVSEFFSNVVGYYEHLTIMPAYERVTAVDSSLATYLNHSPKYPGRNNNCIDYYDKGMLIAFELDARLRLGGDDDGLTGAFARFYKEFVEWPIGSSPDRGYTTDDVLQFFEAQQAGLGERLDGMVNHPGGLGTEALLGELGFEVVRTPERYLGLVFTDDSLSLYGVLDDAAAGSSGLAPGDVVTAINGYQATRPGLKWVASRPEPVTLDVLRGHRVLRFVVSPGERMAISELRWRGDADALERLSRWFGRPVVLAPNERVPLDFYENFHGIETVV